MALCAVLMGVMVQAAPSGKPTHELKLAEMTEAHLTELMANATRVQALTTCFVTPPACQSLEARNLGVELSALDQGGSCVHCSVAEQKHVFALIKKFGAAYNQRYPDQFKAIAGTPLMKKLLAAPKPTHALHLTEYTSSHVADLFADGARVSGVTACFSGGASCSPEGKNLVGQLQSLVKGGGSCTTCSEQQKTHLNQILAEFVKTYQTQYSDQFKTVLPHIKTLLQ